MKKIGLSFVMALVLLSLAVMPAFAWQPLGLTFMQPCKPAEGNPATATWRIRNPNSYVVEYTVSKAGTGQILTGTAPSGDSFFTTPWGAQTLTVKWIDGAVTKAGGNTFNGTDCPVPVLPKTECVEVQQNYGLAELFGPNGEYGLMYFYNEIPSGISVDRQQCVLGWTAVREGAFEFVTKNSCTGRYTWNGLDVTPRSDVVKEGVCRRNGACIR